MVWRRNCCNSNKKTSRLWVCLIFPLFLQFCGFLAAATDQKVESLKFQKAKLKIANIVVNVELAESSLEKETGLMHRKSLGPNAGMLFIFETEQRLSFWMKNTLIDLDIGFFDKNKKLLEVKTMKSPKKNNISIDETLTSSAYLAMYALEVNAGWFAKNKIKVGDTFALIRH